MPMSNMARNYHAHGGAEWVVGGKLTFLPDVESIFASNESHNGYYLQTLLYSSIVR
jgi:hypothetical protein